MALTGWATFAWQSDYGQFYLIDVEEGGFEPPIEITPEVEARRFVATPTGLVVYTNSCLYQQIRIQIFDGEPDHSVTELMSGKPWTQVETTVVSFPSRKFSISSPSHPDPLPAGPFFALDRPNADARIAWMEFQGSRDESVPAEADVIEISLWPAGSE